MRKIIAIFLFLVVLVTGLTSCAYLNPYIELEGDEYTCRLYGHKTLRKITVLSGGDTIATFKMSGTRVNIDDSGFEFIDLNFDGHDDVRLVLEHDTQKFRSWIWNPNSATFRSDRILNSLINPSIDAEAQTISAPYQTHTIEPAVGTEPETYIDEVGYVTYKWRQGNLTAIRRECTTYYSESEIYCIAVWDINNDGELEPTEERWLTPTQYERAGFAPIGDNH